MIMIRMGRAIPVPRPARGRARAVSRKRGRHDPNRANSPAALVLRDADVVAAEHGLEGVPKRAELAVKGGADGVAEEAAGRLTARYPRATVKGLSGYFDATPGSLGNMAVLAAIRDFAPHVLFVGMGMPRQELWIVDNLAALPTVPILPVGAAFDYEAGVQRAAPRWMGRLGVEWLFRLFADPKRLFTRYCIEPWFLIGPALSDVRSAMRRRKR